MMVPKSELKRAESEFALLCCFQITEAHSDLIPRLASHGMQCMYGSSARNTIRAWGLSFL